MIYFIRYSIHPKIYLMSDFLDFKKIPLGFLRTNSINEALDSFYQHSATDKNFKHRDHVYWIRPHSKIRASQLQQTC